MKSDDWTTLSCPLPSQEHAAAAENRQNSLTKPPGSLGILERLAVRLAALQETERPKVDDARIILFAGDHGITLHGVSAYPSAVTVQMLHNFATGGAAISVLARELRAPLEVVDVGTLATTEIPGVVRDKQCAGTRDFSTEPAMTIEEAQFAMAAGRRAVQRAAVGADLLILGEMGIGNTTSAAAVASALLSKSPDDLVGRGTGLDNKGVEHKARMINAALKLHGLGGTEKSPLETLACVGGLEIAALTGAIISSAQSRVPVLIDGFIVSVAALLAVRINPSCKEWLVYSHRSYEQGHQQVLEALDAEPLLDLKLRLGEGSGAALALPIVKLVCALHAGMATFDEANVSGRG
ncbi:Nicotinate-nucleotide--dimethylbenzimidazole phosphoribosyltransferase [Candidatus Filomicrobium marinum]|uniref:Nicotinate-nucleotide--dimethylbenzimidazole phosphoribosyltransferase n=2 Tax=Filomicrobium TaxID=119044 RepID=A0A0D6JEF9_9HYPH|nr:MULTISPECIES: nicotinate-nucleotide--dimethylbenzimidazole phosphoribosyltransferase [Filomicrobium]MCV0368106.1 nicotinate-nucleotide--dimethylbenzimidazole phosphoribosyltransferase [Filomicrobium sp.]CFX14646.1 Nicotinate-nucleotide--dimethylbenzimidazole phosphoribosyltransferase [Candidatus Filomicrobium marinum]CPR17831.1 Nicotinate-nucleotide--dimethylbenzimidazole phosphoribosyltransferase [Candidatus Filomicrobium marinum]SDO27299.1 nicotinate-nucleotide-dimethylbenzimidazole phosph